MTRSAWAGVRGGACRRVRVCVRLATAALGVGHPRIDRVGLREFSEWVHE